MEASGGAARGNTRRRSTERSCGHIEKLRSGSLRVKVYAGRDALLRKDLYLKETVPAGPEVEDRADRVRTKLVAQVAEGRHPRSNATIADLMEYDLAEAKLGRKTRTTYRGYNRKHITQWLGRFRINDAGLDSERFDSFYGELARCREHCDGKPTVRHWSSRPHRCDARCKEHVCRPLEAWTILKIHSILNSAFKRALRRKWVLVNPMIHAEPPPPPSTHASPPTVRETATIIEAAWNGTHYGPMVWFASTVGARLGELCALRWRDLQIDHVDIAHATQARDDYGCLEQGCRWVLAITRSIEQVGFEVWEKDTKTHQHRRIALAGEDVAVLLDLRETREVDARLSGREVQEDDFIFRHRRGPDICLRPGAVSTHYSRFTARLGISTTFHKLRHYSATELITAGVDIRTVAGRLGHSSATTTWKYYSAWRPEADQQAAAVITTRVPTPPTPTAACVTRKPAMFETVAERLRESITQGRFKPGENLPPMKELATAHRVSINAAHAAVNRLADWGYVTVSRGKRSLVTDVVHWPSSAAAVPQARDELSAPSITEEYVHAIADEPTSLAPIVGHIGTSFESPGSLEQGHPQNTGGELVQLHVRCGQNVIKSLCTQADITTPAAIQALVRDVTATLHDINSDANGVLELDIMRFGTGQQLMTYVLGQVKAVRQQFMAVG